MSTTIKKELFAEGKSLITEALKNIENVIKKGQSLNLVIYNQDNKSFSVYSSILNREGKKPVQLIDCIKED